MNVLHTMPLCSGCWTFQLPCVDGMHVGRRARARSAVLARDRTICEDSGVGYCTVPSSLLDALMLLAGLELGRKENRLYRKFALALPHISSLIQCPMYVAVRIMQ